AKVCCFININPFKTVRVLSQMLGLNQSFLKLYHQEYLERFKKMAGEGMNATQLQEYRAFLAKLDEAINQQQEVVAASVINHSSTRNFWKKKHSRTQALNKAVDNFRKQERKIADKLEQKENDDHSQR
ncbi:MAG: flagellar export protein FliJ, partial [Candidatus Thiodiazotropha endolucinida]